MSLSAPEPLSSNHDASRFSCGKAPLDNWLAMRALSNHEKGFAAVYVVHEAGRIVGFYGLAPTAVVPAILPRNIGAGQPPDPVPCLLLGQLAVDRNWAGLGVGSGLLKHAYARCAAAANIVGGRALIVKAVDEAAAAFWIRRGFRPTKDNPFALFRPLAEIVAAVEHGRRSDR
jgi:GNAT superfamily N-acetyltransferase